MKHRETILQELNELSDLVRSGKGALVRPRLEEILTMKLSRPLKRPLASLCRRVGLPARGARLLYPLVKTDGKQPALANADERAEYGICLVKMGAVAEGTAVLKELPAEWVPEALLYRAFSLMSSWNYAEAIPLLESYLAVERITPYQRLVAKVNLAAALVYEGREQPTTQLLEELIEETQRDGHRLLLGNCLELSAIRFIDRAEWANAARVLDHAESALGESASLGSLFVWKWKAIVRLGTSPEDPAALAEVEAVRNEALRRRHWETVRDCDRYGAILSGDRRLLEHVYHGTPSAPFRGRLRAETAEVDLLDRDYLWRLHSTSDGDVVVHLRDGEVKGEGRKLKAGRVLHRLLMALASDFYRPFTLAALHELLYPAEVFNPISSCHRVQAEIRLLRKWFERNQLPLEIRHFGGTYRLIATGSCSILTPAPEIVSQVIRSDGELAPLYKLRETWPKKPFSARDVSQILDVSARSALRLLDRGLKRGELSRRGRGPATRYAFAENR